MIIWANSIKPEKIKSAKALRYSMTVTQKQQKCSVIGAVISSHFSEVFAFSQIKEVPGRCLSVFVDFHLPPAQNNLHAK